MTEATPRTLLAACCPLGDHRHTREVKLRAVRRVILEGWTLYAAAKEAGAEYRSVGRWVAETEERCGLAKEAAEGNGIDIGIGTGDRAARAAGGAIATPKLNGKRCGALASAGSAAD